MKHPPKEQKSRGRGFNTSSDLNSHQRDDAQKFFEAQELDKAQDIYEHLIKAKPTEALDLCFLASIHCRKGEYKRATQRFRQALSINPKIGDAHYDLAKAYKHLGDFSSAEKHFKEAFSLNPNDFAIAVSYASTLNRNGKHDKAIELYKSAITLNPSAPETYWNIGVIYEYLENYFKALENYARATEVQPSFTKAWESIGILTRRRGHLIRSTEFFQEALKHEPNRASLHLNLSLSFHHADMEEQALISARRALQLSNNDPCITLKCALIFSNTCDFANRPKNLNLIVEKLFEAQDPESLLVIPTYMMEALHINSSLQDHINYINLTKKITESPRYNPSITFKKIDSAHHLRLISLSNQDNIPIRIGFVSGDFRAHVAMRFLLPLLRKLKNENASIHLFNNYNLNLEMDSINIELKQLADSYIDIHHLNTESACKLLIEEKIDILIDLSGHSANNRMDIFTQRIAPIHFSWLGYPGSTGMKNMDYLLIDIIQDNPHLQSICTEKLITKDGPFLCFDGFAEEPIEQKLPEERNGYVTFGTLNSPRKYTQAMFKTWAKILKSVDNSKLLIVRSNINCQEISSNIYREFSANGIPADRLILKSPNKARHLLTGYYDIDIALDTFPYSGTTTTLDTLWMGVPVVSMTGIAIHQRASHSLLHYCGHPEWVGESDEEYINIAIKLSTELGLRKGYRNSLRAELSKSELGNPEQFTKDFMKALRKMIDHRLEILNKGL